MDDLADNNGDSWYSSLADLFTKGSEIYKNVRDGKPEEKKPEATKPNWYLLGGIGAAVLLIIVVLSRK